MFGLAAAAVAAMAFMGATSAMATSTLLCNNDQALGSCTSPTTHVHQVATDPKLLTSLGTVLCESALLLGEVLGLGSPQHIHAKLTYTNCVLGGGACTVEEVSEGVLVEVLRTAAELGNVTGSGQVEVNCSGLQCTYEGKELTGHALGPLVTGDNGHVTYTEAKVEKVAGGFLCPSTSKLDALFVSLSPVYLNS